MLQAHCLVCFSSSIYHWELQWRGSQVQKELSMCTSLKNWSVLHKCSENFRHTIVWILPPGTLNFNSTKNLLRPAIGVAWKTGRATVSDAFMHSPRKSTYRVNRYVKTTVSFGTSFSVMSAPSKRVTKLMNIMRDPGFWELVQEPVHDRTAVNIFCALSRMKLYRFNLPRYGRELSVYPNSRRHPFRLT
jgi:hypothetical protein